MIGTLIPAIAIIALAGAWLTEGHPTAITLSWKGLIPTDFSWGQLAFLAGVISSFAGTEISAIHAKDVDQPRKKYPLAILVSCLISGIFTLLGVLAITLVIPHDKLNLVAGFIETMSVFLTRFGLESWLPLFGIMIAVGALGSMASWTVGPSRALLAGAIDGDLPPFFAKTNRFKMPYVILLIQAGIVTALSLLFLWIPSISTIFWILVAITAELYFGFYLFLLAAFLKLRKTEPHLERPYRVPGGKFGLWLFSGLALASLIIGLITGLIPPESFADLKTEYHLVTLIVLSVSIMIPLWVTRHLKRKRV